MEVFRVKKNGKILDYRVGQKLDLGLVKNFFSQSYAVIKLWQEKRHVVGWVKKNGREFFLKLSTTEGIGVRTETEKVWNYEFNKHSTSQNFLVPKNFEDGYYNGLYYVVMGKFDGPFVCDLEKRKNLIEENIDGIISFAQHIQSLSLNIDINDAIQNSNHQEWFKLKTKSWLDSVPKDLVQEYGLSELWNIVVSGAGSLSEKPRHGDFTPWHISILPYRKLGLIDGEHAHSHGVENYDICYFVQRVHTVLGTPNLAMKIFQNLLNRGSDREKLGIVLAARAIGGFLDQSFSSNPNYEREKEFKNWVLSI